MKIKIQITVESDKGQPEVIQEVAHLDRGIAEGDVPSGTDINTLASFYTSVVDGMAIRARDGTSRKTLKSIADCAMAAWDPLVCGAGARNAESS